MIALALQLGGSSTHPGAGVELAPLLLILGGAAAGGLLLPVLRFVVGGVRSARRRRRERRRRIHDAATAERRARAMMSELCPYGWRAHVTLLDGTVIPDADPVRDAVALDWYELVPGGGEPIVMRRVWAPTVAEALEAMVSDRQTDETLEQIELRASADGASWPDA